MSTLWGSSGSPERPLLTERIRVRPAVTNWTLALWYLMVCAGWYWLAVWLVDF